MLPAIPARDTQVTPVDAARRLTQVLYVLYALTPFTGLTALVAIVINHIKYADVRDTVYGSHFRWQMRTFWWGLSWPVLALLITYFVVGGIGAGGLPWFPVVMVLTLALDGLWLIYRIVRGGLRCIDGLRMPV